MLEDVPKNDIKYIVRGSLYWSSSRNSLKIHLFCSKYMYIYKKHYISQCVVYVRWMTLSFKKM